LVEKPKDERQLGRYTSWTKDTIKIDLKEKRWEWCGLDSTGSGSKHVADCSENSNGPSVSKEYSDFLDKLSN
jgi:hypothetical protein